ncbi:hypothetical protein [Nocardia seriolae]|uniref:Uncharacterized protein n=2 Tax=Nocardia seriolae TaxID=37332 RepID=A0ABC8B2N4_9NOCA|nr:hypothetical protein [Nocardia seriolae]APB00674.1 hypothetical protein NS506_06643 [Nocardia seriolae]WKY50911.1 hypothetical protein Q5P07_28630 [Nocardia seriolae]
MSDRHSRSDAKSYVAQPVRKMLRARIVWRTGLPQPSNLRPRRAPGKARLGKWGTPNRPAAEQPTQPARTDTGEFLPGEAQPGPEGPHDPATGTPAERPADHAGRKRVVVTVAPYAERGRATTGPGDVPERAGKTWDWYVNTTCWDWYTNSPGRTDRGDADE